MHSGAIAHGSAFEVEDGVGIAFDDVNSSVDDDVIAHDPGDIFHDPGDIAPAGTRKRTRAASQVRRDSDKSHGMWKIYFIISHVSTMFANRIRELPKKLKVFMLEFFDEEFELSLDPFCVGVVLARWEIGDPKTTNEEEQWFHKMAARSTLASNIFGFIDYRVAERYTCYPIVNLTGVNPDEVLDKSKPDVEQCSPVSVSFQPHIAFSMASHCVFLKSVAITQSMNTKELLHGEPCSRITAAFVREHGGVLNHGLDVTQHYYPKWYKLREQRWRLDSYPVDQIVDWMATSQDIRNLNNARRITNSFAKMFSRRGPTLGQCCAMIASLQIVSPKLLYMHRPRLE